mgnify:CR=1 FL=1
MKKIIHHTSRFSLLLILISSLFFSCAEAPKKEGHEKETKNQEEQSSNDQKEAKEVVEDQSFMLPSPIQIAAIFNRAGLSFEQGLTNPVENSKKYNTKTSKYLNFGVYSADLAYVVLNEKQQLSIDYLNVVKQLSEEIGMPGIFGTGKLVESFEKNVGNRDTVLQILTTIKRRTDQYLAENRESSKEAIFFSSAWLEGMYLGANSADEDERLTPRLVEQMTILDNIIKAIKKQKDPSLDIDFMLKGLTELHRTFEDFESVKQLDQENADLNEISLTSEEMNILKEKISKLRNQVIAG